MSHNIDMTNGRANMAFLGDRKDIWHRLGQQMQPGMTLQDWQTAAGLNWESIKVPALVDLSGTEFSHLSTVQRHGITEGAFRVRSDNGYPLGYGSDGYQSHQPSELFAWAEQYVSVDSRFKLDTAGSLKGGRIIWISAVFQSSDDMIIAGDKHRARLLMTTTFDGTGSTKNKGTMVRTVCNNTLDAALSDKSCTITTRHNTKFDRVRVGRELATIAQGFERYKAMGDAMAQVPMPIEQMSKLFKHLLEIPFDANDSDISTRKMNQFRDLSAAYSATKAEGTEPNTAWSALNAVTRYVDHDRSTRGGNGADDARFLSAQFGSGAQMKAAAVEYLTATDEFKAVLSRPFNPGGNSGDDIKSILSQPFNPSRFN